VPEVRRHTVPSWVPTRSAIGFPAGDAPPRRHDLAWLAPGASPALVGVAEADQAELQAWVDRRLPLVVGRQDGQPGGLRLGFTLPGTGARRRVAVRAPRAAILVHGAPPPLEDMLPYGPEAWQAPLGQVARALRQAGLTPRVYGSLVTQAFSGETCLRPDSDVDILIDCASRDAAMVALEILDRHGEGSPRLDGELRMPHGWAVAWRELAQALVVGGRVLAKSDSGLQLMSPEDFLGAPISLGAVHGNPGYAPVSAGNPA
jgi:phosphoribosyl-dephospho-CoA transferase